jgi:hypothetical protein
MILKITFKNFSSSHFGFMCKVNIQYAVTSPKLGSIHRYTHATSLLSNDGSHEDEKTEESGYYN